MVDEVKFELNKMQRSQYGLDEEGRNELGTLLECVREAGMPESAIHYNFDPEAIDNVPDNYRLYVTPLKARGQKDGNGPRVQAITFYAAPSFDAVLEDEKGRAYLADLLAKDFASQHAASLRPNSEGVYPQAPWTLLDHIERKQRSDSLATYTALKKTLVDSLKDAGLHNLNAVNLRKSLSNAAIAQSLFPSVPQQAWQIVLERAGVLATEENLDPTIFQTWAKSRDHGTLEDDKLDLNKLAETLGFEVADGEDAEGDD